MRIKVNVIGLVWCKNGRAIDNCGTWHANSILRFGDQEQPTEPTRPPKRRGRLCASSQVLQPFVG